MDSGIGVQVRRMKRGSVVFLAARGRRGGAASRRRQPAQPRSSIARHCSGGESPSESIPDCSAPLLVGGVAAEAAFARTSDGQTSLGGLVRKCNTG